MNQGYVSKQNMGGSQKEFGSMKAPAPKSLPKGDNLKRFEAPNGTEKGPMQHKAQMPTAPKFKQ